MKLNSFLLIVFSVLILLSINVNKVDADACGGTYLSDLAARPNPYLPVNTNLFVDKEFSSRELVSGISNGYFADNNSNWTTVSATNMSAYFWWNSTFGFTFPGSGFINVSWNSSSNSRSVIPALEVFQVKRLVDRPGDQHIYSCRINLNKSPDGGTGGGSRNGYDRRNKGGTITGCENNQVKYNPVGWNLSTLYSVITNGTWTVLDWLDSCCENFNTHSNLTIFDDCYLNYSAYMAFINGTNTTMNNTVAFNNSVDFNLSFDSGVIIPESAFINLKHIESNTAFNISVYSKNNTAAAANYGGWQCTRNGSFGLMSMHCSNLSIGNYTWEIYGNGTSSGQPVNGYYPSYYFTFNVPGALVGTIQYNNSLTPDDNIFYNNSHAWISLGLNISSFDFANAKNTTIEFNGTNYTIDSDRLVLLLRGDDGNDSSRYANIVVSMNASAQNVWGTGAAGYFGAGYNLSGPTNTRNTLNLTTLKLEGHQFTIMAYVRYLGYWSVNVNRHIAFTDDKGDFLGFGRKPDTGKLTAVYSTPLVNYSGVGNATPSSWIHETVGRNNTASGSVWVALNGSVNASEGVILPSSPQYFALNGSNEIGGQYWSGTGWVNGTVDQIVIWNESFGTSQLNNMWKYEFSRLWMNLTSQTENLTTYNYTIHVYFNNGTSAKTATQFITFGTNTSIVNNVTLNTRIYDDFSGDGYGGTDINVTNQVIRLSNQSNAFARVHFDLPIGSYNVTQAGSSSIFSSTDTISIGADYDENISTYGAILNLTCRKLVSQTNIGSCNFTVFAQNTSVGGVANKVRRDFNSVSNKTLYVIGQGNFANLNVSSDGFFLKDEPNIANYFYKGANVNYATNLSDVNFTIIVRSQLGTDIAFNYSIGNTTLGYSAKGNGTGNKSIRFENGVNVQLNISTSNTFFTSVLLNGNITFQNYTMTDLIPVSPNAAVALNGNNISQDIELNTIVNLTGLLVNKSTVCLDINHPSWGNNVNCTTNQTMIWFNISYFRKSIFNDSTLQKQLNFTGLNNVTIYVTSHQYDEVDRVTINLTALPSAGVYPTGVKIYINGSLSNNIGFLYAEGSGITSIFNDSTPSKNTSSAIPYSTIIGYISLPKSANATSAIMNFSGYANTTTPPYANQSVFRIKDQAMISLNSPSIYITNDSVGNLYNQSATLFAAGLDIQSSFEEAYTLTFTGKPDNISMKITSLIDDIDKDSKNMNLTVYLYNYPSNTYDVIRKNQSFILSNNINATYPASSCTQNNFTFPVASGQFWNGSTLKLKLHIRFADSNPALAGSSFGSNLIACDGTNNVTSGQFSIVNLSIQPINIRTYPFNPYMEFGTLNGVREWNYSNNFSFVNYPSNDFSSSINTYLASCANDSNGICNAPVYISSQTYGGGIMQAGDFRIDYTNNLNPITLSSTLISSFLNRSVNSTDIPITFSNTANSSIKVNDLRFDYAGGNATYTVTAHNSDYSNNRSMNITFLYSGWRYKLPKFVEYFEFIPTSANSKNVSAFGQTKFVPILNLSFVQTTNRPVNFSIYLNQSFYCVNLSFNRMGNRTNLTLLPNSTWKEIVTNASYLNVTGLWMYADYNCNASTWQLFNPELYFRACADGTICDTRIT